MQEDAHTLAVHGMSCEHCVAAVTDEVGEVAGVTSVEVDLDGGQVTVTGGERDAVAAAIAEAGYDVVD